ncbi:MAG: cereblon family protein [Gammaproteobacteria bacterium]|nr:cereblon family protein [Gammaproteobacteria bacterium]
MPEVADQERLEPKLADLLDDDLEGELEDEGARRKDYIYCAVCSTVIGRRGDRAEVNGSHDHRFTNPYGLLFHVGCFSQALGCEIAGPPQRADTWFMGFQWRIANCSDCRRHLGWYFDRIAAPGGEFFYGLILDRIQYDSD